MPPSADKPVVLYFHGNGASLVCAPIVFAADADGSGLLALSYRGYGGSTGRPSEAGLMTTPWQPMISPLRAIRRTDGALGGSLGTGVAVALAAARPIGHMILQSPFTSAADVAAARYWFVPVRLLMKDQFRSDLRIAKVTAPVLVLHGDRDDIVPIALGERLYAMINAPKRFVRFRGVGHNDLGPQAVEAAKQFLTEPLR